MFCVTRARDSAFSRCGSRLGASVVLPTSSVPPRLGEQGCHRHADQEKTAANQLATRKTARGAELHSYSLSRGGMFLFHVMRCKLCFGGAKVVTSPAPIPPLLGYADRLSVAPGETIQFMLSAEVPRYRASLVRLIQ